MLRNWLVRSGVSVAILATGVFAIGGTAVAQTPGAATFTCTQVIGFSQSADWFFGGPNSDAFLSVVEPGKWQILWMNAASIDKWADPNFEGWTTGFLDSQCDVNSSRPDRVVLNISSLSQQGDPDWWAQNILSAIDTTRGKYPGVQQFVLQAVIGGLGHSLCYFDGDLVIPTVNDPVIDQAIARVVGPGVIAGPEPEVSTCAGYADMVGHLADDASGQIARTIGLWYMKPTASFLSTTRTGTAQAPVPGAAASTSNTHPHSSMTDRQHLAPRHQPGR